MHAELEAALAALAPLLGAAAGAPQALEGGITNRNFRLLLGGRDVVVRMPGKDTGLLGIDRSAERFPGLLEHDLTGSLYAIMRAHYDLAPTTATERLEPVAARPHEAPLLGVPEGAPLMLVERVAFAPDGTPVEFARDRHHGAHARFLIHVVPGELLSRAR